MRTFPSIRLAAFADSEEREQVKVIADFMRQVSGGLSHSIAPGQSPSALISPTNPVLTDYLYLPGRNGGQTLLWTNANFPAFTISNNSITTAAKDIVLFGSSVFNISVRLPADAGADPTLLVNGNIRMIANTGVVNLTANSAGAELSVNGALFTISPRLSTERILLSSISTPSPSTNYIWNDSAQKAFLGTPDGVNQTFDGTIFAATASATNSGASSDVSIVPSGVGTVTLPAGFFVAGKTVHLVAHGYYSNLANATLRLKAQLTDSTPTTVTVADTGATSTLATASTNKNYCVGVAITCRTTGATGTVQVQMSVFAEGNSAYPQAVNTSTATIDTTKTQQVKLVTTWGAAGNTITISNLTLAVRY